MARNLLGAVLGQQTSAVVTLADPLAGYRIRINLRMQKAYIYGSFVPDVVQFIVGIVQQGWNCFDVGANIGYLTLLLHRRAPGGTVYAFEPLPSAFATLCENVDLNAADHVRCEALALGSTAGIMQFHYRSEALTAGGSILTHTPVGIGMKINVVNVPVMTGDQYAEVQKIDHLELVKIDVEGAEGLVLTGMQSILTNFRPPLIIELHELAGSTAHLVQPLLTGLNYECLMLDPSHLLGTPRNSY